MFIAFAEKNHNFFRVQQTLIDTIKASSLKHFPAKPGGGNGKHRDIFRFTQTTSINELQQDSEKS